MRSDEEYADAIFAARAALVDAVNAARHAGLTVNVNTFEITVERRIVLGPPSRSANAVGPIPSQGSNAGGWLGAVADYAGDSAFLAGDQQVVIAT